ncbi:MAG: B12-binding domain-containing protein [Sedimentitalea sp.]
MSKSRNANADEPKNPIQPAESLNEVGDLAARALSVVAARANRGTTSTSDGLVERLLDSAMGRSKETYRGVARHMLSMGIAPEYIVDEYIPAVARRMGDEWCDDRSSFAAVTMGGSRLQALLRELSTFWKADEAAIPTTAGSSALVLVPPTSHHTLGGSVLATQMRRIGLSVRLSIGGDIPTLASTLKGSTFDTVIISASGSESTDHLRELVQISRQSGRLNTAPVVIGGGVLEQTIDIQAKIGADLATNDIFEALDFCKIATPRADK